MLHSLGPTGDVRTRRRGRRFRVFLAVSAELAGLVPAAGVAVAAAADTLVEVLPGNSIQALVDANPEGTTFVIKAGVHRRQQVVPRNGDSFIGEPGAVLDGERAVEFAFGGDRVNVTVRGLVIENYATPTRTGVIRYSAGHGYWVVENNEVRFNGGIGIAAGPRWQVRGNYIHHNGQLGMSASGEDIVIEGNEIAFNNTEGIDPYWEAGGTKFVYTFNLKVRNNHVHDNHGPGLWTDINNVNTLYEGNRVVGNFGPGIFHEISYDAVIRNNTVEGNGFGYTGWVDGAGILVNSSPNVEIYGNTVRRNNDGIAGIQADRGVGIQGPWELRNLSVHDNVIVMGTGQTGIVRQGGLTHPVWGPDWNNRFDHNTYTLESGDDHYTWDPWIITTAEWRAAGQDANGTWTAPDGTIPTTTTTTTAASPTVESADNTATTVPPDTGTTSPPGEPLALAGQSAAPVCDGRPATIIGTDAADTLVGTTGADVIAGLGGDDVISGGGGEDVICGGPGRDAISGGAGSDRLYGEDGDDHLMGGPGRDVLVGGAGSDNLEGNRQRDALIGGKGRDSLHGGGEDDILLTGSGRGFLKGTGRQDLWQL